MGDFCLSENFAKNLKRFRKVKDLSQTELGAIAGYSQNHVSLWESGKHLPGLNSMLKLSDFFNVAIDHFLYFPNFYYHDNPTCLLYKRLCNAYTQYSEEEIIELRKIMTKVFGILTSGMEKERQERLEIIDVIVTNLSNVLQVDRKYDNRKVISLH